jgi:ElaB/YqjD/DUF883 family membrane-anchored ribosome-binding protein
MWNVIPFFHHMPGGATMTHKTAYADEAAVELREIMRHASALLDATAGEADERIKQAREKLEERLVSAKSKYADFEGRIEEKIQAADQLIHDKPYHAVGGSFLLGLLLGWFMSRK